MGLSLIKDLTESYIGFDQGLKNLEKILWLPILTDWSALETNSGWLKVSFVFLTDDLFLAT